jgi:hypothetical protein
MGGKDFHTLRVRYRSAFEACKHLINKRHHELSADERKALATLAAARRDFLAALGGDPPLGEGG